MTRDTGLIYAAGFVRSATVGLVGVTLAIYLANVGFTTAQIGLLIGVGLAGASVATVIVGLRGDAWRRKRVLIARAALSTWGYIALTVFTRADALITLAFAGTWAGTAAPRRRSITRPSRGVPPKSSEPLTIVTLDVHCETNVTH